MSMQDEMMGEMRIVTAAMFDRWGSCHVWQVRQLWDALGWEHLASVSACACGIDNSKSPVAKCGLKSRSFDHPTATSAGCPTVTSSTWGWDRMG